MDNELLNIKKAIGMVWSSGVSGSEHYSREEWAWLRHWLDDNSGTIKNHITGSKYSVENGKIIGVKNGIGSADD